jgi:hypothetical protein
MVQSEPDGQKDDLILRRVRLFEIDKTKPTRKVPILNNINVFSSVTQLNKKPTTRG